MSAPNPIELFNEFIRDNVDPKHHAHFADNDDNQAERVREAIRGAVAPGPTLSAGDSGDGADALASPRDIITDALGGGWPQAEAALEALDRAGYSVVSRVWVAQLDLTADAGGYIGVHTTAEGAVAAVVRWAGDIGIVVDDLTTESGSRILDDHPDIASYGVFHVEVQR